MNRKITHMKVVEIEEEREKKDRSIANSAMILLVRYPYCNNHCNLCSRFRANEQL